MTATTVTAFGHKKRTTRGSRYLVVTQHDAHPGNPAVGCPATPAGIAIVKGSDDLHKVKRWAFNHVARTTPCVIIDRVTGHHVS